MGTLTYITLVHILPEVFFASGHEEHDHFGDNGNFEVDDDRRQYHALAKAEKHKNHQHEHSHQVGEDLEHSHDHGKQETQEQRLWKLVTLLAGLYTAELLRFV